MAFSVSGKSNWSYSAVSSNDSIVSPSKFGTKKQRISKRKMTQISLEDQYEELKELNAQFASMASEIAHMSNLQELDDSGLDPFAPFDALCSQNFSYLFESSEEEGSADQFDNRSLLRSNKFKKKASQLDPLVSPSSPPMDSPGPMIALDVSGTSFDLLSKPELIHTISNMLPVDKLGRVIDIVSESNAPIDTNESGEIEFDLSALDETTLYKLNEYVSCAIHENSFSESKQDLSTLCYPESELYVAEESSPDVSPIKTTPQTSARRRKCGTPSRLPVLTSKIIKNPKTKRKTSKTTKRSTQRRSRSTQKLKTITHTISEDVILLPVTSKAKRGPETKELFKMEQVVLVTKSDLDEDEIIDIC